MRLSSTQNTRMRWLDEKAIHRSLITREVFTINNTNLSEYFTYKTDTDDYIPTNNLYELLLNYWVNIDITIDDVSTIIFQGMIGGIKLGSLSSPDANLLYQDSVLLNLTNIANNYMKVAGKTIIGGNTYSLKNYCFAMYNGILYCINKEMNI